MGPTIKPATLDNSAIASPVTPSSSRRRFLIGSDGIAAAASLRTVTMAATTQRRQRDKPFQPHPARRSGARLDVVGTVLRSVFYG